MKVLIIVIVCMNLILSPVLGYAGEPGTGLSLSQELGSTGSGSEYVSGNFPGAILMPVNLWGSVGKPGIHHIPTHTDLVTLLSLAGGPGADAKLDQITIKRRAGTEEKIVKIDGDDLLTKAGVHSPILEANDIIIVPRDKPAISNNTVTLLTFVGSIFSVVLAGYAVSQLAKK